MSNRIKPNKVKGRELEEVREKDPDGRIVVHHRTVDSLGMMLRAGTITPEMHDAARDFQVAFTIAQFDPIRAPSLLRIPGTGRDPELTERQMDVRRRVHEALEALGGISNPASLLRPAHRGVAHPELPGELSIAGQPHPSSAWKSRSKCLIWIDVSACYSVPEERSYGPAKQPDGADKMIQSTQKTTAKSNDDAVAAFISKKAEIDAMLTRLQALSDDHFGYSPDGITWSHAEGLAHYAELLKRITDQAFNEGEHAE